MKITSLKNTNLKDSICLVGPIASSITTRKLINILEKNNQIKSYLPQLVFNMKKIVNSYNFQMNAERFSKTNIQF